MKKFFKDISREDIYTIIIALLIGMFVGVFFQSGYSIGIRSFFHNIYTKINPNSQKDSKTLINDRATKDIPNLPQKDIFETPKKKDCGVVIFIKKIFHNSEQEKDTIDNFVIN